MQNNLFGGLDFGTSGARISIINLERKLVYSNSVNYSCSFKKPTSWINSCERILDSLPTDIKSNIAKLAISGTSGTLTACNLRGNPIGEAIPYYQACNDNEILIESIIVNEDHLRTPYSSLAKALNIVSDCNLNLTKIQSLPVVETPGKYAFFVDVTFCDLNDYFKAKSRIEIMATAFKVLGEYNSGK